MQNIMLQHFTGEMGELHRRSQASIAAYAEQHGAEYRLLSGNVFHPDLSPPCQKLAMLGEEFDQHGIVVMVDTDMFVRKGGSASIFEADGIGISGPFQRRLKWRNIRKFNGIFHWRYPYWGGAVWRLTREQRQRLRRHLPKVDLARYNNGRFEDEGVMHQLARHEGMTNHVLPGGDRWALGSYETERWDDAVFVHIRPRAARKGPRKAKIDVLDDLVARGLIEA